MCVMMVDHERRALSMVGEGEGSGDLSAPGGGGDRESSVREEEKESSMAPRGAPLYTLV